MPELRKDPIIGRWVIISTERRRRPSDFAAMAITPGKGAEGCPFCPGREGLTPPEILAYRPEGTKGPNTPGWSLRVVPNKFPALQIEGDLGRVGVGIFDKMNGVGAHEVIIETPTHAGNLAVLPAKSVENVCWAFKERVSDLAKDRRFEYALVFKNHGAQAGATLEHPHSQLIALPIVPLQVKGELQGARSHFSQRERCIWCDILRQEIEEHDRVVVENEDFVALCPYAPRFPFETWILPRRHSGRYEESSAREFQNLAQILSDFLRRLAGILNNPPFNFVLHNAPFRPQVGDGMLGEYFHWHFEVMPTLTTIAGFEHGTGFHINPVPPEEAAKALREVQTQTHAHL